MRGFAAAALLCFSVGGLALAELPPDAYRALQDKAPEVLTIKVRSVVTKQSPGPDFRQFDHAVQAEVRKVERSASGSRRRDHRDQIPAEALH